MAIILSSCDLMHREALPHAVLQHPRELLSEPVTRDVIDQMLS